MRQAYREMPFNVACAANLSASVGCVALSKAVTAMVSALRLHLHLHADCGVAVEVAPQPGDF